MEFLEHAFHALWKVSLAAILLGAGLPALFALGIRLLSSGTTMAPDGGLSAETAAASSGARVAAFLCFGIVVVSALFGIVVIIFGKQIFG